MGRLFRSISTSSSLLLDKKNQIWEYYSRLKIVIVNIILLTLYTTSASSTIISFFYQMFSRMSFTWHFLLILFSFSILTVLSGLIFDQIIDFFIDCCCMSAFASTKAYLYILIRHNYKQPLNFYFIENAIITLYETIPVLFCIFYASFSDESSFTELLWDGYVTCSLSFITLLFLTTCLTRIIAYFLNYQYEAQFFDQQYSGYHIIRSNEADYNNRLEQLYHYIMWKKLHEDSREFRNCIRGLKNKNVTNFFFFSSRDQYDDLGHSNDLAKMENNRRLFTHNAQDSKVLHEYQPLYQDVFFHRSVMHHTGDGGQGSVHVRNPSQASPLLVGPHALSPPCYVDSPCSPLSESLTPHTTLKEGALQSTEPPTPLLQKEVYPTILHSGGTYFHPSQASLNFPRSSEHSALQPLLIMSKKPMITGQLLVGESLEVPHLPVEDPSTYPTRVQKSTDTINYTNQLERSFPRSLEEQDNHSRIADKQNHTTIRRHNITFQDSLDSKSLIIPFLSQSGYPQSSPRASPPSVGSMVALVEGTPIAGEIPPSKGEDLYLNDGHMRDVLQSSDPLPRHTDKALVLSSTEPLTHTFRHSSSESLIRVKEQIQHSKTYRQLSYCIYISTFFFVALLIVSALLSWMKLNILWSISPSIVLQGSILFLSFLSLAIALTCVTKRYLQQIIGLSFSVFIFLITFISISSYSLFAIHAYSNLSSPITPLTEPILSSPITTLFSQATEPWNPKKEHKSSSPYSICNWSIPSETDSTLSERLKHLLSPTNSHHMSINALDMMLMTLVAYSTNSDMRDKLDEFFATEKFGKLEVLYQDNDDVSLKNTVIYSAKRNTIVVAIRGTTNMLDAKEASEKLSGPVILSVMSRLLPFIYYLPVKLIDRIFKIPTFFLSFFETKTDVNPFLCSENRLAFCPSSNISPWIRTEQIVRNLKEKYPNERIVLAGHSLGGALATTVASRNDVMAFSVSSPGLQFANGILKTDLNRMKDVAVAISPENDVIADMDFHVGINQRIDCQYKNPIKCHSVFVSLCEIYDKCGGDMTKGAVNIC